MGIQQLQSVSKVTIIPIKTRKIVNSWRCTSLFRHSKILILKRIHVRQNTISTPAAIRVIRLLCQQVKYCVKNYSSYHHYSSFFSSITKIICNNKPHSTYHIPFSYLIFPAYLLLFTIIINNNNYYKPTIPHIFLLK